MPDESFPFPLFSFIYYFYFLLINLQHSHWFYKYNKTLRDRRTFHFFFLIIPLFIYFNYL